jgi:hypothetical protein
LPFKCNLQRYTEDLKAGLAARLMKVERDHAWMVGEAVGLCTLESS